MHRDRAVGAGDPDVHVQPERVVAPHDVAEELVVPPVMRRVDDALVLPAAPRVRAGRTERELLLARERMDLRAALLHLRGRFLKAGAAAGADLDFGGDQLTDDVLGELGAVGGRLQRLEAVRQLERLGVEQRELLFDRDRQVGAGFELGAVAREQLLPRALLFLAHSRERSRAVAGGGARRRPTTSARRQPAARPVATLRDPRASSASSSCSFLCRSSAFPLSNAAR